jgi:hypothetical protein
MSDDSEKTRKNKNKANGLPDTVGGEDESSTEKNGDDSHLHDNQKSRVLKK